MQVRDALTKVVLSMDAPQKKAARQLFMDTCSLNQTMVDIFVSSPEHVKHAKGKKLVLQHGMFMAFQHYHALDDTVVCM